MASQTVTIDIPKAHWLTSNMRLKWQPKMRHTDWIRQAAGFTVLAAIRSGELHKIERGELLVLVGYPSNRHQDAHNASDAAKPAIDGCVDGGLIPDDDTDHLVDVRYRRDVPTGRPGWYRLRLEFTPTTNERQQQA